MTTNDEAVASKTDSSDSIPKDSLVAPHETAASVDKGEPESSSEAPNSETSSEKESTLPWIPRLAYPADSTVVDHKPPPPPPPVRTTALPPIPHRGSGPLIPAVADSSIDDQLKRIRLGICAMDKKARSKPMAEILRRLDETLFHVVFFGDDMILNQPIEEWPRVDVLIAFYSSGYPLEKATRYVELTKPFVLNDLNMQRTLKDRRKVYDLLEASGIDVPRHVYLSRDGYVSSGSGVGTNEQEVVEHDDHIELNGFHIHKPFVEKPVDADDHNIAIYYPTSAGGGCKKLFRKIGDRSSEFYADINEVRRDGSYIYEEFVVTQGTDVKMYTVGPEYGHAEARKSPTVDGKVERNPDGKEVRFPVILTFREKEIARRIVLGFNQWVCGFDLLRVQEGDSIVSYVCDVNGWSFVKNSRKYYDDCAQILTEHILAAVKPKALTCYSTLEPLMMTHAEEANIIGSPPKQRPSALQRVTRLLGMDTKEAASPPREDHESAEASVDTMTTPVSAATMLDEGAVPVREIPDKLTQEPASMSNSLHGSVNSDEQPHNRPWSFLDPHQEELRCVIAITRHGDRTPKQKLKVNTTEPHILEYFHEHSDNCQTDLKVKAKKPMIEFLETVRTMIKEKELEAKGADKEILSKLKHMRDVMERWKIVGLNRKLQIKPKQWEEFENEDGETDTRCTQVQLILKWGGNLTKLGEKQAINLGQRLRHEMYPDATGGGILRLHSTFRHDLKIKTSDEGRVMKTAAACAKGLLELEGEIPPILVSLVHKEKDSIHMLDPSGNKDVKMELDQCKQKINVNLQKDVDFCDSSVEEHEQIVGPRTLTSLHHALQQVRNPRQTLFKIRGLMGELIDQLEDMLMMMASGDESRIEGGEGLKGDNDNDMALSGVKLYKGETLLELTERWKFLHRRLYDEEKDKFDLSRVPDVHDNVRFDMLHNPHLGLSSTLEKLYESAKIMADCVVPQEYGTTIEEKRSIGSKMCNALLEKIMHDLIIAKTDNEADMRYMINMAYSADLPINTMGRRVRTRLYFTSESHLHTLLNVLRFGASDSSNTVLSQNGKALINQSPELCYLTQVILRLFEDPRRDVDDPKRFRVEVMFSPGATNTPMHMSELVRDSDSTRFDTTGLEMIGKEGLTCDEVLESFEESIRAGLCEGDGDEAASMSTLNDGKKKEKSKETKKKKAAKTGKPEKSSGKELSKGKVSSDATAKDGPKVAIRNIEVNETPKVTNRKSGGVVKEEGNIHKSALRSKDVKDGPKVNATPKVTNRKAVGVVKEEGNINKSALRSKEDDEQSSRPPLVPKNSSKEKSVKWSGAKGGEEAQSEETEPHKGVEQEALTEDEDEKEPEKEEDEEERIERMARLLARQYFWKSIAVVSLFMGIGCLFLSSNIRDSPRYGRRPTRR